MGHWSQALKQTALVDFHRKHGAKMVPFAGYDMPVQYEDGILASHRHCRENASIFDVSHMIQLRCAVMLWHNVRLLT